MQGSRRHLRLDDLVPRFVTSRLTGVPHSRSTWILATAVFLSLLTALTAQAQILFDLPPQSLADALTSVGRLAHLNIYFDSSLVDGRQAPAVKGALSADEALTRMLAGTHLHTVRVEANTVRIVADPADKPAQSADAPETGTKRRRDPKAPPPAAANRDTTGPTQQAAVAEVTVTGRYEFLSVDTSGTTNLPLPIEKVPQSISLVSDDFIKAADLNTLASIAEYTPGAINEGNQLGLGTLIKIRGFTPGIAVDGIDVEGGTWFEPDNAIFERREIVKGPASVVYGISSPGGLVNYVTKSATPQTPDYLYARAGQWNSFRLEGQVAGALDPEGHIRAIGVVARDQGDSFINHLSHATTTVYGGINADPGQAFSAYLHGGFERSERTAFDGVPTESDGTPAPVGRSFCICASGLDLTTDVYHAEADLTWHATGSWDVSVKGNYQSSRTRGIIPYSFGLAANGDLGLGLETFNPDNNHNYGVGVSSLYRLDGTGLRNSFISLAALYQDNRQTLSNSFYPEDPTKNYPTVNIFSGQAAVSQAFYRLAAGPLESFDIEVHERVATISAQSVLQVLQPLSLLLGVSYSKPDVSQVSAGVDQGFFSVGGQTSYRAGVTYQLTPHSDAYVSFSQSFKPQVPLAAVGNTALPPLKGAQYEAGIKYRSADGSLLTTAALFQIKQHNQIQYGGQTSAGADYYNAIGEVTHTGIELQSLGHITPQWQINAGYAYLDPRITRDVDPIWVGQVELFLPKQTASLYSSYTPARILHGLSFGAGAHYIGPQHTAYDRSTRDLAGYVLFDAEVGYSWHGWMVQLNGHNILDRHCFINNYQTLHYGNVVGEPANLSLSIRHQF